MPRKIDLITELYRQTVSDITADSVAWRAFLHSAAYQYKYPFADQVLIYAQRPTATACAELELWNKHFGRWVNRGATGIALINGRGERHYLNYVFDVGDTHHRDNKPFDIWSVKPEYEADVIEALQNRFIDDEKPRERLADAVIAAAINLGADNVTDYLQELSYEKAGSLLEELDEDNLRARLTVTLQASVAYAVLTRLGYDADRLVGKDAFLWVQEFNTPATVNVLGTATRDISEICLREIERTVKSVERSVRMQDRTFDENAENRYNGGGRTENTNGNGGQDHDIDLQDGERRTDTQLGDAGADELPDRQVRTAAADIPQGAPQGDVHDDTDRGAAEPIFARDRRDGEGADRDEYIPDGTEPWGDGADESRRSAEMDADNEQFEASGRGRSADGVDLSVNLPSLSDPNSLMQIVRHGDYLRVRKESNYPSRTAQTRMDWAFITQLIRALIKDQNYLDKTREKAQTRGRAQETGQMSLFDNDAHSTQEGKSTKDAAEQTTDLPKPDVKTAPKPKQSRKRKTDDQPTIESLASDLEAEYARWDELLTNGGSDPTWSDGVNMNLVQGRIVARRRDLLQLCGDGEKPAILDREEPPRMSDARNV